MVSASMGGFSVYNLSIKISQRRQHRRRNLARNGSTCSTKTAISSARTNFNPECYDPIDRLKPMQNIACIANIMPIPRYLLVQPLYPIEARGGSICSRRRARSRC